MRTHRERNSERDLSPRNTQRKNDDLIKKKKERPNDKNDASASPTSFDTSFCVSKKEGNVRTFIISRYIIVHARARSLSLSLGNDARKRFTTRSSEKKEE